MADKYMRVTLEFNEEELKKMIAGMKTADDAAVKLKKDVEDVGPAADKSFKDAASGIQSLVTGVKAFLGLALVNEIKNLAKEASKVAAAGEGIRSAFANLGGTEADVKKLSEAVGGTVNNLNLMKLGVQALQKGVGLDSLGKVLAYVNKQAAATGGSLEQLASVAINSIGRQSTRGLAQLGLSMQNVEKRSKEIGFVPALLEDIARKTKEMGDLANPTADAYDRVAASQANLKEAFGRLVNSEAFRQVQGFVATGLDKLTALLSVTDKFAGVTQADLERQFKESQERTARLEEDYLKTRNPIKLNRLRKELAEEKDLRFDMIIQMQKIETDERNKKFKEEQDAFAAQQDDLTAIAEEKAKVRREKEIKEYQERMDILKSIREIEIKDFWETITFPTAEDTTGDQAAIDESIRKRQEASKSIGRMFGGKYKGDMGTLDPRLKDPEEVTKNMKFDFEEMLDDAMAIVNVFNSLDNEDSGAKKFVAGLAGVATIIGGILEGSSNEQNKKSGGGLKIIGKLASLVLMFLNEGGKVPGSGPNRDSVPAMLTPGEFVVKRESSKRSALLLDAINAGELDDRILMQLSANPIIKVDQEEVVRAINSIPQVDYFMQASTIYEYRRNASDRRVEIKRRTAL